MAVYRARCLCRRWFIRRLGTALAVLWALVCNSAWASAQAERRASRTTQVPVQAARLQGPIDFRCDRLEVLSKPEHRQICRGHVVVRRDELILCCNALTGASDIDWAVQRISCVGDVRLQRGAQIAWADYGQYDLATGEVVLTGHPVLERAGSRMAAEQLTVRLDEQFARVLRPRGQMTQALPAAAPPAAPTWLQGPLPALCPIGAKPPGPV